MRKILSYILAVFITIIGLVCFGLSTSDSLENYPIAKWTFSFLTIIVSYPSVMYYKNKFNNK